MQVDKPQSFIGEVVTVKMDRPLGSVHPKHPEMVYPVNYGFVENTMSSDGAELDAYVLGVAKPLEIFKGRCIAFIERENDNDPKLIIVPEGMTLTDDDILEAVDFQEKYFTSKVIR